MLLRGAAAVPLTAGVLSSCGDGVDYQEPSPDYEKLPRTREGNVMLAQLDKGPDSVVEVCRKLDFSWLKPGESVLLKVASNSKYQHPSTTSGDAIRGMVRFLKEKGAGRVVVADQAGIEWVRYRADSKVGATRSMFEQNGLMQASRDAGAEVHFFDDEPFETGYFAATPPSLSHWKGPINVPNIIRDVDHIIYMPRLSAHAVAGYTMALKVAVGWLRDDSRLEFHQKGASTYEKYTEITYTREIKERLRLVFTYASKVLLDIGPDQGTTVDLPHALILATTHPGDHDAVGSRLLTALDDMFPSPIDLFPIYPIQADYWNKYLVEYWGNEAVSKYEAFTPGAFWKGVNHDPALRHAYLLDGVRPKRITITTHGIPLPPPIMESLSTYDDGLFNVVTG
ncbi:MAG: DUF362 domain-containing protein [Myxococcota bacterium]